MLQRRAQKVEMTRNRKKTGPVFKEGSKNTNCEPNQAGARKRGPDELCGVWRGVPGARTRARGPTFPSGLGQVVKEFGGRAGRPRDDLTTSP
eukprot:16445804-Heterocapsa_arctica.AAC.1